MLQHLIIQFSLYDQFIGRLGRLKTKQKNFKLSALKVVVVTVVYERWSLTRGSKHSDLNWKLLYFGKLVIKEIMLIIIIIIVIIIINIIIIIIMIIIIIYIIIETLLKSPKKNLFTNLHSIAD